MSNQKYLVKYLHEASLIPVKSTWIRVIQKGYFQSWTGLTVQLVKNVYLIMWPQKMTHKPNEKNIESTKPIYEGDPEETAIKKLER